MSYLASIRVKNDEITTKTFQNKKVKKMKKEDTVNKIIYLVCFTSKAHQKIVWLNVAMKETSRMHIFNSVNLKNSIKQVKHQYH